MTQKFDVVGIGRAYTDVIGTGSEALVREYGIPLGTGRYFSVQEIKAIIARLGDTSICAGGATPNTIAGLAALGAKTGLFAKAAPDATGKTLLQDMQDRGITPVCPVLIPDAELSGTCVAIMSEGGERSFALNKGCVEDFTQQDFDAFDFEQTRSFVVYSKLLTDSDVAPRLADLINRAGRSSCRVVISLSEVRSWAHCPEMVMQCLLPSADILIGNQIEVEAFLAVSGLLEKTDQIIITTEGAGGATARRGAESCHVPIMQTDAAISTLGAGDQFLAGFLKGQLEGWPLPRSLKLAARCAAAIVERVEARPRAGEDWRGFLDQV